jgi:hypothetical protein
VSVWVSQRAPRRRAVAEAQAAAEAEAAATRARIQARMAAEEEAAAAAKQADEEEAARQARHRPPTPPSSRLPVPFTRREAHYDCTCTLLGVITEARCTAGGIGERGEEKEAATTRIPQHKGEEILR